MSLTRRLVLVAIGVLVLAGVASAAAGPRVLARIGVGSAPIGLASGAGSLWAGDWQGGSIVRVDAARNRVTARIDIGGSPYGVAYGAGSIWATSLARPASNRRR